MYLSWIRCVAFIGLCGAISAAAQTVTGSSVLITTPNSDAIVSYKNTGSGGREYFWDSGSQGAGVGAGNFAIWDNTAGALRLAVTPSGNIGIGTNAPQGLLTIASPANDGQGTPAQGLVFSDTIFGSPGWSHAAIYSVGSSAWNGSLVFATDGNSSPDFGVSEKMRIGFDGNVGIGTSSPQYKLSVNGTIQAKEVLVNTSWADYVFQPHYRIAPLTEVAAFIKANHHLPNIPSESEVKENGVSLGDMQSKLLAKIEELTLQMIQLDQNNRTLTKRVAKLQAAKVVRSGRNGGNDSRR